MPVNRASPHGNGSDLPHLLLAYPVGLVALKFSERSLIFPNVGGDEPFDDDLCVRRDVKIDAHTLDHLYGLTEQRAGEFELVHAVEMVCKHCGL